MQAWEELLIFSLYDELEKDHQTDTDRGKRSKKCMTVFEVWCDSLSSVNENAFD